MSCVGAGKQWKGMVREGRRCLRQRELGLRPELSKGEVGSP